MDIVDRITTAIGCHHCGGDIGDSVSDLFCSQDCQTAWHASRTDPLTTYSEPDDLPCHIFNQVEQSSRETTPRRGHVRPDLSRFHQAFLAARPFPIERRRLRPATDDIVLSISGRQDLLQEQVTLKVQRGDERAEVTISTLGGYFAVQGFEQRLRALLRYDMPLRDAVEQAAGGSIRPWHRPSDPAASTDAAAQLGFNPAEPTAAVLLHQGRIYAVRTISREHAQRIADEIQNNIRSFAVQAAGALTVLGNTVGPVLQQFAGMARPPQQPRRDPMQHALEARRNRNTGPAQQQRAPRQITPRSSR